MFEACIPTGDMIFLQNISERMISNLLLSLNMNKYNNNLWHYNDLYLCTTMNKRVCLSPKHFIISKIWDKVNLYVEEIAYLTDQMPGNLFIILLSGNPSWSFDLRSRLYSNKWDSPRSKDWFGLVWFYGTSTIVGYLMSNPLLYLYTVLFQTIQFSITLVFYLHTVKCKKQFCFKKLYGHLPPISQIIHGRWVKYAGFFCLFICLFVWVHDISTFEGYLMPNPFLYKGTVLFETIQFNISIQFNCQEHFYPVKSNSCNSNNSV